MGISNKLNELSYFAKVTWLCGYAAASAAAALLFFVMSAQGADFLRLLSEERSVSLLSWPRSAFYMGVVLWSLACWYASRLLAIRRLPGFQLPAQASATPRIWIPRILGAAAPAVAGRDVA